MSYSEKFSIALHVNASTIVIKALFLHCLGLMYLGSIQATKFQELLRKGLTAKNQRMNCSESMVYDRNNTLFLFESIVSF